MNEFQAFLELLGMLGTNPRYSLLLVLLVLAAIHDCRFYKIPNWLTFGGAATGLIFSLVLPFSPSLGLGWALGGMALGFGLMLPMYVLGVMGAGDVKLMAMVGAFLGLNDTLYATLSVFICGGVAALLFSIWKRALGRLVGNIHVTVKTMLYATLSGIRPGAVNMDGGASVGKMPYAVSIAVGTTLYVLAHQIGLI